MSVLDDRPAANARHAQIRQMIRDGDLDLPGLLLGEGEHDALEVEVLRMKIGGLLSAVPGITTAKQALAAMNGIYPGAWLGELTIGQRTALAHRIRQETP